MHVLNKCFTFRIVCLINIYAYLFTQECVYNNGIFVLNTQSRTQWVIYELVYKSRNRNRNKTKHKKHKQFKEERKTKTTKQNKTKHKKKIDK
jgi:hypothetical protein